MILSHSKIWSPEAINDIHARAQGAFQLSNYKPFRELAGFDELVFLASGLTRFPLEGYKEKCNTETVLGGRFSSRPLVLDTPIYVRSDESLPEEVRIGLARGTALTSTALSTGGKLLGEERNAVKKLIYEIPFEANQDDRAERGKGKKTNPSMPALKTGAIQINISVPVTSKRLAGFIRRIRNENADRPVFVRIPAGRVDEDVATVAAAGCDGIVIEGFNPRAIFEPQHVLNYCRIPIAAAIVRARESLKKSKLLGELSLIAATDIKSGADAAKALALGADCVVIDESALIALNYYSATMRSEDHQEPQENTKSNLDTSGERLAKFINSMTMEMGLLARSLGKGDLHSLEYEDLSALTIEASMTMGVKLSGQ